MRIVRDEDIDWTVYHVIIESPCLSAEALCEKTGYAKDVIMESLARLKRFCLIDCRDDETWRACTTEEIIFRHQMADVFFGGLELSGGVIRYRPSTEENR